MQLQLRSGKTKTEQHGQCKNYRESTNKIRITLKKRPSKKIAVENRLLHTNEVSRVWRIKGVPKVPHFTALCASGKRF